MSYNSKAIKTDVNAKPIPQYYNPVTDEYEVLQGTDGAARQVLYGPDGNPISTTEGKLAVRAEEIETLLTVLKGKDFATQTTLAALLQRIQSGIDVTVDGSSLPAGAATAAKQDTLATLVGTLNSTAVSDPAAAGAVIALLKGVLSRLQAVEGKIDDITDGTTPAKTEAQVTGSNLDDNDALPVRSVGIRYGITDVATNFTVTAGASSIIAIIEGAPIYEAMLIVRGASDDPHPYELSLQWFIGTYTVPILTETIAQNTGHIAATRTPVEVKSPHKFRVILKNKDEVDHTYERVQANFWYV